MFLLLRRAAIFVAFVMALALLAAAAAHAATRDREVVAFSGFAPGTIVVKTGERSLYYVLDQQRALRFPVGAAPGFAATADTDWKAKGALLIENVIKTALAGFQSVSAVAAKPRA